MEATVHGKGTLTFYWKRSCASGDSLILFIDGVYSGNCPASGWVEVSKAIDTLGVHKLRWKYSEDGSGASGGWQRQVQLGDGCGRTGTRSVWVEEPAYRLFDMH